MSKLRVLLIPAFAALLGGCATDDHYRGDRYQGNVHEREVAGTVIGGIIGGVIGHEFGDGRGRTTSTVIGAAIGALIGGELARDRDVYDDERRAAYNAFEGAPTGRRIDWRDSGHGVYGSYTPMRTYRSRQGNYCRTYEQRYYHRDGREEVRHGTACRQPDGQWRIVD